MKITSQFLIILLSVTLSSCAWFKPNPYASFSVGDVDEDGPDTEATILVGDPQVISRPTLINDRLRESKHIESLLDVSINEHFDPQILRDIKVVNAFASQLGVAFDPSLGSAFTRGEDISSITTEIELLKLRNELNKLQQQINNDPANNSVDSRSNENSGSVPNPQTGATPATKPDPSLLTKEGSTLAQLKTAMGELLKGATDELKNIRARSSNISSSPEERFEDLNAYRARLRQRQAEINLDDVHDTLGNTLYRLQLNATVLPGEIKNKYGVLDFAVKGSEIKHRDLEIFYYNWLIALNLRNKEMDTLSSSDPSKVAWDDLIEFLTVEHYMQSCTFQGEGNTETIYIAPTTPQIEITKIDEKVKIYANKIIPIQNKSILRRSFYNKYKQPEKSSSTQLHVLSKKLMGLTNQNTQIDCFKKGVVPLVFINTLTYGDEKKRYWIDEHVYTYQAQPTERVQRLSTLASAANSMQSAFALAATLPQYGLGIDAGAAASRVAVGMADAVERTPLVIGYTDTDRITAKNKRKAHFGYIFGPKAILQSEENQLVYKQVPASHSVFADLSVPSWWPSLTLDTRSVWAGNWHNSAQILKTYNKTHEIVVRLRPGLQGLNSLNDFIYSNASFPSATEYANIDTVYPQNVSLCARGVVDFVIKGKNLWHNPIVSFLGQNQEDIKVLRDMDGILVKVNLNELPLDPSFFAKKEKIVIWTKFGKARSMGAPYIHFDGSKKDCSSDTSLLLKADKNFYVKESSAQNIKVHVIGNIPSAIRNVKVASQILPDNHPVQAIKDGGDATNLGDGNGFVGNATPSLDVLDPDTTTARIQVGLKYQLTDGGAFKYDWASPVVFYPKAGKEKIKINGTSINVDTGATRATDNILTGEINLELPNRMNEAYPGFKQEADSFVLKPPPNFKDFTFRVDPDWGASEKNLKLNLRSYTATSDSERVNFETALCSSGVVVSLEFKQTSGTPGLLNNSITFKKNCN